MGAPSAASPRCRRSRGDTTWGRSWTTASGSGGRSRRTARSARETLRHGAAASLVSGHVDLDAEVLAEGAGEGDLSVVGLGVGGALQQDQRLADDGEAQEVVGVVLEEGVLAAG